MSRKNNYQEKNLKRQNQKKILRYWHTDRQRDLKDKEGPETQHTERTDRHTQSMISRKMRDGERTSLRMVSENPTSIRQRKGSLVLRSCENELKTE